MTSTTTENGLYRAIWRWHFYAGLFVAPFLIILAVTGAVYLFNDEINDALYPELRFVASSTAYVQPGALIERAVAASPGSIATRIDMPTAPDRSAQVFITPARGEPLRVFIDPNDGRVLGSYVYTDTPVGFADVMHGSLMIGTIGDRIVELAACWTVVLIATGLFLWWPRRADKIAGVVAPRLRAKGRIFWRDLHAVTGLYTGALILFLVLTGLPWAGLWGDLLNRSAAALGVGYPAAYRTHGSTPVSSNAMTLKQTVGEVPWTLEMAPAPISGSNDPHAGHAGHRAGPASAPTGAAPIDVKAIATVLAQHGLTTGYRLSLPQTADGVYTAYTYPDQPQGQRTLHIDRYSGQVLVEIGYADYGWVAKAVELGVALHMGNVGSSRVDLQACKLEYSIVSPK